MKEKSCGCIIVEKGKVLIIQQTDGFWGFPKGHVEANETEIETAKREVKEETNLDVEIVEDKTYKIEYVTDKGNPKEVVYFIAKKLEGEIKAQEEEITNIEWLTFEEAMKRISFDNAKEMFKKVIEDGKISKM